MPASHIGTCLCSGCSASDQLPVNGLENQQRMAHEGDPQMKLLVPAWHTHRCCGIWGCVGELVDLKFLSYKVIIFFNIMTEIWVHSTASLRMFWLFLLGEAELPFGVVTYIDHYRVTARNNHLARTELGWALLVLHRWGALPQILLGSSIDTLILPWGLGQIWSDYLNCGRVRRTFYLYLLRESTHFLEAYVFFPEGGRRG